MGRVAQRKIDQAAESGRADSTATFSSKSERKAARKAMWSPVAFAKNVISDAKMEHQRKREFYRNLRMMKINRKNVAKAMHELCLAFQEVGYELQRAYTRLPRNVDDRPIVDAIGLYNRAFNAVDQAALEHTVFAKQPIYYTKELAA